MLDNFSLGNDGVHSKFLREEAGGGLLKPAHESDASDPLWRFSGLQGGTG